jgi:putative MATE family efflux protein
MIQDPSEPTGSSPLAAPPPSLVEVEVELPGLWKVTWPLFISLALSLSLIFTDAFFLSRISDAAAGAAGALNPLLGATVVLFSAVGQAGASVAGRLHGARRYSELPVTYLALLGFNLAAGILVSGLLFLLHPYLPGWLGLRGASEAFGKTYLAVLGSFQFLKAVQLAYGNVLNSRGETRWVMFESVATNVTNIGLNLAMLKGMSGLPRLTVASVTGATVISLVFGMLFTIAVVHLRFKIHFPFRTPLHELRARLRPILHIGLPSASEPIAYQSAQTVINMLVISFGAAALAARTYVISFFSITTMLWSLALGIATQILVAHRVGAGRLEDANREFHRALRLAVAGNLTIALLMLAFHGPLLGLLTQDPAVLRQASRVFGIAVVVETGRAVNIVAGGALRSSGDARFVALVGASMMWSLGIGSAFVFGRFLGLGLSGVWIALAIDETTRGIVNYSRWRKGHWRTAPVLTSAAHASHVVG